jgi:hypothetical protein
MQYAVVVILDVVGFVVSHPGQLLPPAYGPTVATPASAGAQARNMKAAPHRKKF